MYVHIHQVLPSLPFLLNTAILRNLKVSKRFRISEFLMWWTLPSAQSHLTFNFRMFSVSLLDDHQSTAQPIIPSSLQKALDTYIWFLWQPTWPNVISNVSSLGNLSDSFWRSTSPVILYHTVGMTFTIIAMDLLSDMTKSITEYIYWLVQ